MSCYICRATLGLSQQSLLNRTANQEIGHGDNDHKREGNLLHYPRAGTRAVEPEPNLLWMAVAGAKKILMVEPEIWVPVPQT